MRQTVLLLIATVLTAAIDTIAETSTTGSGENAAVYHAPVAAIRQAAIEFLESLSPELQKQASFTLDDKERRAWSNLPVTAFKREY